MDLQTKVSLILAFCLTLTVVMESIGVALYCKEK